MKSLFIVLDGLDGSGKGEMIKRLRAYFSKRGVNLLITREPTDGEYGKQVKEILKTDKDSRDKAEECLQLFVKDREEHLKNIIEPFLERENAVVICDRYYYSTIAFQHTQGIDLEKVVADNMDFRTPDIAFILDLPAEMAIERIEKRGADKEKFEQLSFMKELRQNFLKLKDELDDNIKIIDASKSKDEVFEQIKKEMDLLI
ncbi:MAG: dTMP kinase [Nanoarchaeota archaeon]|nr:dTMP kinase [Nanoarchaeota archaeon]MBU1004729.1 dTMP kinase [Nanoarchaeota archaeon]MBU1945340.1 dTMP kinase [Nanoarchaeota archaeon]